MKARPSGTSTGRTLIDKALAIMIIEVSPASYEEKTILRNLMQLYRYDFSEMDGKAVDNNGLFTYRYLDLYWVEPERFPFLVRVDGQLSGFTLLRKGTYFPELEDQNRIGMMIAEFFVMRKFRRQGVGSQVAKQLFDQYPGRWETAQTPENRVGQAFWRTLIDGYTIGDFREVLLDNEQWHGPVQVFDNAKPPMD
jgi:predicted acetyltransferase